jgi:LemA protein
MRAEVDNGWAQIDVQLKRRYDLIPNLVETVKGYAAHERETLEKVIQARNAAMQAQGVAAKAEAENMLTSTLRSIFALAEAYPNLRANENFLALQEELTSTENRIAFARQFYNDVVMRFNARIQQFPTNIVANMFGFTRRDFFEVQDQAQREAPQVKFTS